MGFNFDPNSKSYSLIAKENPKDRIEVEIGDALDSSTFHPQFKLKRWDNEINCSIRLKHETLPGNVTYSDDGTKITWKKGQWKAVFYDKPDASEEGGFEFEVHIPKKPPVNYLEFTVNTKELDWFYQPALTQEEIDQGASRPENVVGSYAVYYKNCPANYVYGKEYKAGKAFHVYRPHVVDSAGNSVYGDITLDEVNGIMRISVPQEFLNTAIYPVIVDPTFGYTSTGASYSGDENIYYCLQVTGAVGTGTSISAALRVNVGTDTATTETALYLVSDKSRIGYTNGVTFNATTTPTWYTMNFIANPTLSAVNYYIVVWGRQAPTRDNSLAYDSGGTGKYNTAQVFSSWPTTLGDIYNLNRNHSVYVTYTAASTGTNIKINIGDVWKDVTEIKINIGDVWKTVTNAKINIGDAWKNIF